MTGDLVRDASRASPGRKSARRNHRGGRHHRRDHSIRVIEVVVAQIGCSLTDDKYPRIVQFVDALPKGPTGKILKRALPR